MISFFDNLAQLMPADVDARVSKGASRAEKAWVHLFQTGQLEVQPLHTIRGRSTSRAFILIDEAQNLTPHEIKTVTTRAANGTKVVLAGDPFLVDNHFLDSASNGLIFVTEKRKSSPMTGAVYFTKGERSPVGELAASMLWPALDNRREECLPCPTRPINAESGRTEGVRQTGQTARPT